VVVFGDAAAYDNILAQLQKITPADVQRVAKSIMDDTRAVTLRYLPEAPGAKGDIIADSKAIQAVKIDIPAADIPTYTLAAADKRRQPPAPAAAIAAKVPAASEKTLANGLRVIVANRPGLPLVAAELGVAAGSALDPIDRAGLASMTADLTTRGTTTRSATEISRQIESLGASLGAGASVDASSASLVTRADKAREVFALLADVVQNPAFKTEELERARQEALDGLAVSLQRPATVGSYAMARWLFGSGAYGKIASPKSISALTRDEAAAFHSRWWRPDNAVLVITGDITPEAGFALAQNALGTWKNPDTPLHEVTSAASPIKAAANKQPLIIDIPKIGQAAVLMGHVGPARNADDYFATLVANNVLGGGYSSRLSQEIRIKRGLSYSANSRFAARQQAAPIIAAAQTRNDAVPQVFELMSGELVRLGTEPISEAEVTNRKAVLIGSFGRDVETTGGLASQISALVRFGLPLSKLGSYAVDIDGVTPAAAAAAAKAHFDPAAASVVVVGDAKVFGARLKARLPQAQTIAIDKLNLDSAALQ
jgi:zinc protease